MKVIGIDYGEVRIGVSCSDDLGMFAHPLETIHVKKIDPIKRIIEIAEEKKIQAVVIGMPRNLDGSYGSAAKKVESFLKKIKTVLPEVQVVEQDERFTTTVAQKNYKILVTQLKAADKLSMRSPQLKFYNHFWIKTVSIPHKYIQVPQFL